MTERLHRLIDSGADPKVIQERVVTIMEEDRGTLMLLRQDLERIGTDHEHRIRFLEKTINYTLGAIGLLSILMVGIPAIIKAFK